MVEIVELVHEAKAAIYLIPVLKFKEHADNLFIDHSLSVLAGLGLSYPNRFCHLDVV
jgi:hypothetical protein